MKYNIKSIDITSKKETKLQFDSIEVSDNLSPNTFLLLNNQKKTRIVYSFTKSRSDFTSGGAKPFRQKGTGRARMGTSRSPLKVGGSVIFGPKPRFVFRKSNKQFSSSNIKQLLLSKISNSFLVTKIDQVKKAKEMASIIDNKKIYLLIIDVNTPDDIFFFNRVKNLSNVYVNAKKSLNYEDIIRADELIYTQSSFDSYFSDKESSND